MDHTNARDVSACLNPVSLMSEDFTRTVRSIRAAHCRTTLDSLHAD